MNLTGTVEEAQASYIVRDFETEAFENRKAAMRTIAEKMKSRLSITDLAIVIGVMSFSMPPSLPVAELTAQKFPLWASRHLTSLPAERTCTAALSMSA